MARPTSMADRPIMITFFLPKYYPNIVKIRKANMVLKYMNRIARDRVADSLEHLKSPILLAKVQMLAEGVKDSR